MTPLNMQWTCESCLWTEDEDDGKWETECGHAYCFDYDFRHEARTAYQFCPGCGGKLKLAAITIKEEAV